MGRKLRTFCLCSFGEHKPRKGTALNKDSVSDGIQGVVRRDSGFNLRTLGDGKANVGNVSCEGYC